MTNEVVNVPELRFTGFEDEWKKKKLDDVANYRRGSFPQPYGNKEWYDEKNGEPFVQVVDVDKNMKLHDQTKQKISDLAKPKSVKGFKGDIVVTLQGSIGRVALLHYDAYIDRTLLLIYSFKIEMNKNYFKYVLYLLFLKEKERAPGGTIKTITKKVLSNFKIDIPNVGEQEKIGEFFSKLDRQIELEEQKLAKLEEQKKGYMQKVFSQELRFKDENGNDYDEWKEEKLENIADFQNGKAHENLVSIEGEYVLVNSKFISTDTRIKKHVSQQLTPLNKEDIAIVMSDIPNGKALAKCFLVDENNKYSLNQRIGRIYNILGDSRFLYLILNRNKQLLKYDSGVGQTNLKKSEITDILLNWPIKEEQEKIGDFFSKLDEHINKQNQKIAGLKLRKQGFLQKMFV